MTKSNDKTVKLSSIEKVIEPILHRWHERLADKYGNMPDDWKGWEISFALETLAEDNNGEIYISDILGMLKSHVEYLEQDLGVIANKPNREQYDAVIKYLKNI